MNKLKKTICQIIDSERDRILAIADAIWKHPEKGYFEFKTAAVVREVFEELSLPFKANIAITGCRAELDTGKAGLTIAILGELDGLCVPTHPDADPETGIVHACGHNFQIATMLGCAMALSRPEIKKKLSGKIVFMAVPAEECSTETDRTNLIKSGKIQFLGGKQEMIRQGAFDGVDVALMVHSHERHCYPLGHNGFIMKHITFTGKASHAAGAPENGINALNAANIAMHAIDAQRETFKDEDNVRVHGIISRGGDVVNAIPDTVVMEIQIRANNFDAIKNASMKTNRALQAGAMAVGANVAIETFPGYMPLRSNMLLVKTYEKNLRLLDPEAIMHCDGHHKSSTDMGDLSCIMPILHAYSPGISGQSHSKSYQIADAAAACVEPAKLLAMTVIDLMNCEKVESNYELITKKEYLTNLESFVANQSFNYGKNEI